MKKYLSIIRKAEFVDLFKYGNLYLRHAVELDGNLSDQAENDNLFQNLTAYMNQYEYSFEYLIIEFNAESFAPNQQVRIKDLLALYAFDYAAKREMETSFDPRIEVLVSPWGKKFEQLQDKLTIQQNLQGVDNVWQVFNLTEENKKLCSQIITDKVVNDAFSLLFANKKAEGELSIWTYLLRYERHSPYPRSTAGYFCDALHAFCNFGQKTSLIEDVAESAPVFEDIIAQKDFKGAMNVMLNCEIPLFHKADDAAQCRYWVAAPLFLFLKNVFEQGLDDNSANPPVGSSVRAIIEYSKKIGEFEFSIAAYLLGITLGYDKTYDALYETVNLPILKKKTLQAPIVDEPSVNPVSNSSEQNKLHKEVTDKTSDKPHSVSYIEGSLFPQEDAEKIRVCKKFKKNGEPYKNSVKEISIDQWPIYEAEGYKQVK